MVAVVVAVVSGGWRSVDWPATTGPLASLSAPPPLLLLLRPPPPPLLLLLLLPSVIFVPSPCPGAGPSPCPGASSEPTDGCLFG